MLQEKTRELEQQNQLLSIVKDHRDTMQEELLDEKKKALEEIESSTYSRQRKINHLREKSRQFEKANEVLMYVFATMLVLLGEAQLLSSKNPIFIKKFCVLENQLGILLSDLKK